jgi:hypothetical protein
VADTDPIEAAFLAGAVTALRRRAFRQHQRARDWTVIGEKGERITSGEGAIALRIAEALDQVAADLEAETST